MGLAKQASKLKAATPVINKPSLLSKIKNPLKGLGKHLDNAERHVGTTLGIVAPKLAGNIPTQIRPVALAAQRQYGAAAANLAGGLKGEAVARVAGRGVKTIQKASSMGLKSPKQLAIAGVRGATTGLVKNRRLIGDAVTGGAVTLGEQANALTKRTIGHTKIGKALTKDISTPVFKKLQIRKNLRKNTGGLFKRKLITSKFIK